MYLVHLIHLVNLIQSAHNTVGTLIDNLHKEEQITLISNISSTQQSTCSPLTRSELMQP